jgi:hypothetical protein
MKVRKLMSHLAALVLFAVAAPGFSLGRPPVTQDPEPGITTPQASDRFSVMALSGPAQARPEGAALPPYLPVLMGLTTSAATVSRVNAANIRVTV